MFCKYCGNQMDDDSVFCAKCGKKVGGQPATQSVVAVEKPASSESKTTGTRKLFLQRKKGFYGCAVALSIWIDDAEQASLPTGGEATLPLSGEAHTLYIVQNNFPGKFKSKTYVINAGSEDVYGYIEPTYFHEKWKITFEYK